MTVAANTPINTYTGTGAANNFPFTFPVYTSSQVLVTVINSASAQQILALGVDYSVGGLSATGSPASSGSITLINAGQLWLTGGNLATGYTLVIQSNFPLAQSTSIRNQGDFYRSSLEDALDNLQYQLQQLSLAIVIIQGGTVLKPSVILTDTANGKTYTPIVTNGVFGLLELT